MKFPETRILLIESSGSKNKLLLDILQKIDVVAVSVSSIEAAIQKAISFSPELIICQEEFGDYTGFQVYNLLEKEILKNGIPFILMLNEYNMNSILMAEELGIDGFIFPPFEPEKISNIITSRIRKFRAQQNMSLKYFKRLYELIPLGIFISENRRITEANSYFYSLLNGSAKTDVKYIDSLFDFEAAPAFKTKLSRFLNGLNSSMYICGIPLKTNPSEKYKINLFYLENGIPSLKVVGIIIPMIRSISEHIPCQDTAGSDGKDTSLPEARSDLFTNREQQILELSGQGLPIKLIADKLAISERTVEKHRSNILRKTNTGNIIEALFFARKHSITESN